MSMEHIFRNLNDIRVFDLFSDMGYGENYSININEIIEVSGWGETERIQIEDSIDHLVREQILSIELIDQEWTTGCKDCLETDRLNLPRHLDHETHKPYETGTSKIEHYFLSNNKIVICLVAAVMESSFLKADKIMEDKGE